MYGKTGNPRLSQFFTPSSIDDITGQVMKLHELPEAVESELRASSLKSEDFKVFTSLRYDPRLRELTRRIPIAMEDSDEDTYFLSRLHHKRLRYSARVLGWDSTDVSLERFVKVMDEATAAAPNVPQRVRVCLGRDNSLTAEASPVPDRDNLFSGLSDTPAASDSSDPFFEVVADSEVTDPSLFVRIKTTKRETYDLARQRAGIKLGDAREVLIIGPDNVIFEGSTTSVAILRDGEWITPELGPGGTVGVLRSFLLDLGFVKEGRVTLADLHDGDPIIVFNGVQGVCKGVFRSK